LCLILTEIIVADGGFKSIKGETWWRQAEARTFSFLNLKMSRTNGNSSCSSNNIDRLCREDEKYLVPACQSNTKSEQFDGKCHKKSKVKGKKLVKYTMIQCKTFVFKPSNNGVINFGYKGLFDETALKETDRVFKGMAEEESDKNAETGASENENIIDAIVGNDDDDLESDKRKRKQPKSTSQAIKIVVESKDIDPSVIKQINQEQKDQQPLQLENDKQKAARPISIPRRRLNSAPSNLPVIKEETQSEMDVAEWERWFFEDFCGGVLPPPEELDDWSEPASASQSQSQSQAEEKILREKLSELQNLGCKKVYDSQGNKVMLLTPEAKEKLLQSKEFKDYAKKLREMGKLKAAGKEEFEKIMKIEIVHNKDTLERTVRQPNFSTASIDSNKVASPKAESSVTPPTLSIDPKAIATASSLTPPNTPKIETTCYISSAGLIETPIETKPAANENVGIGDEIGQLAKPARNCKQPPVDLSIFKRRRI
jgi:hypothetical protein